MGINYTETKNWHITKDAGVFMGRLQWLMVVMELQNRHDMRLMKAMRSPEMIKEIAREFDITDRKIITECKKKFAELEDLMGEES